MRTLAVEPPPMLDKEERRVKFINRNGKVLNLTACLKIYQLIKITGGELRKKLIGDFSSFTNLECSERQVRNVEIKQAGWPLLITSDDKSNIFYQLKKILSHRRP